MRKILSLALSLILLFGLFPGQSFLNGLALAQTGKSNAVFIAASFRKVGYDWDGKTLLDPPRDFPWQKPGQVCWGRPGYYMPDASKAINTTTGMPVSVQKPGDATIPLYYTQIYLDVRAEGGLSTESNPYYAVVDSVGQLWFDPDGFFNDGRYDPTADPLASIAPFENHIQNSRYVANSCNTNPRAIIDTSSDTNTKGPYFLNKFNASYSTRQYFWDYKKDDESNASNRMWRIGWADLIDYPFNGAILPDGTVSVGVVKNGDWDYNLPIVPFTENEYHTEIISDGAYTPGKMSSNPSESRPPEFIYRAPLARTSPVVVEVGDMRLSTVTIRRDEVTKTYPKDTIVQDGDWDLGLSLINFLATEKHADNIVGNNQYDSGEWIYSLTDSTISTIPAGAVRLTNVNTKRYKSKSDDRLALELGCGIYAGDVLIMSEVFEGGCHTPTYDLSVLTDVWMGQSPSYTAARLRSPNSDIPEASQRIQKATVLDPGLDQERYYLLPGTTFNNLHFEYREYLGVEIFFDNGVDNSIGLNDPNDIIAPLDLSDNYKEGRTCEQFIGAKDGIGTLDLGRSLEKIKKNYKFYNISNEIPPRYGCGEAIYYLIDPNRYNIQPGDKRYTDVDLVVGGVHISYKRNTTVADGDADVGLELYDFIKEKLFIPNLNNVTPEYGAPFDYDPAIDDIYYDNNDNYVVDVDDIRLTDVEVEGFTYYCGSLVTAGDNYFLESPINMITIGGNGNYRYLDSEIVPGDIGLNVEVDKPLKVEQTSTITVSVDPPPKENETVYVSIQSPQANEFNIFRGQAFSYKQEFVESEYNTNGTPMHWYGEDEAWVYELPFEFPFMGRFYNRVYVTSNGFLNFSTSYPMPIGLNDFDARLMVYGDDLAIYNPTDPKCITSHPGFSSLPLVNYDPEDIYILKTNDSITFRWRAQTQYIVPLTGRLEDSGSYPALDSNRYGLIDASVTLFADGTFKFSYLRDVQVGSVYDHIWKLYNRVNNVTFNSWVTSGTGSTEPTEPIVGITNGSGIYAVSPFSGLKNMAAVDGAYVVIGGAIYAYVDPWGRGYFQKSRFYADEKWTLEFMPFNEPSSLYPDYDEWKPYEDFRVLTADNPVATFNYTPYRGTCLETGIPEWVEIRAYKDIGGRTIAPPDSSYTFIPQYNYYDPTVWSSKWTKLEYWQYPWGIFQKTKYFVYPPIISMMPKELKGVYDCFGIERLQIEPEELKLVPSKSCINSLDERQPALWLNIYDSDNPADINDPQGMAVATSRKTIDAYCTTGNPVQVDYGLTDYWNYPISCSPVGANFLTILPAYFDLFKVGDIVYIEPVPEYRRIVRIDRNLRRIYFDLPLIASHCSGTQVVPNPIVGNYNIKGGGIKGLFTSIGGAGQRYIVQVRDDGSYDFWRWYEPLVIGQVRGALDPNDLLYSWQNNTCFDRSESCSSCPSPGLPCPSLSPGCIGTMIRTPFPYPNPRPPIGLEDVDCSLGQSICSICGDTTEFPKLGEWNSSDRYGLFGNNTDGHAIFPNACTLPYAFGSIWTWGVPVLILPNRTPVPVENIYDDGGKCIIAAWPQDPETPMNIRLYLNTALFDYNSKIKHPPHFLVDSGMGIDYCGEVQIRVSKPNPDLNFSEFTIIDHALQNSTLNYTFGEGALSPLPPPNPQIASRYYPLARNFNKDLRSYSGGQTNTGRITSRLGLFNAENPSGNAWNAYPAMWNDQFVKLGTEFMPMTDYGLAFYLKGGSNPYDKSSFFGSGTQRILKVEIEGPFAFPRTFTEDLTRGRPGQPDLYSFRLNPRYEFNEYANVPLDYDFSGKLVIDGGNASKYELMPGYLAFSTNSFLCATLPTGPLDFSRYTQPIAPYDSVNYSDNVKNPWLRLDNKWFYWGASRFPNTYPYWTYQSAFLIDELIPVGAGPLKITVTMYNGSKVSYTDCCEEPPITEIPIHGIKIDDAPKALEIDEDHNFSVTLTEGYIPEQDTEYCNDAFLVVWQDRGIIEPTTNRIIGMGDGHIANPPRSSNWYKTGYQFPKHMDINLDGKISFQDYETEVMGTYDLATNTWSSGIIDGRTFMREYGIYDINLSAEKGSQLTTIGYDFGGIPDESGDFDKKQDHVISEYETIPVYINAYKYADDNNDRGFTPLWRPVSPYEYSHEVYLSGMSKIIPTPRNDLVISYTPDPLTAGVTPELVDPSKPLSFLVLDENGNPVNLHKGVIDKDKSDYVADRNILNVMFKDPHPDNKEFFGLDAKLPQYYWLRTDLQNNDGSVYDNESIYFSSITPFDPISTDFSLASEGKYKFFGFCANDAGSFLVRVYTPDRRHYGETTVSVKLPSVKYKIVNDEDPEGKVFEVPGSPDFVLTAVDKRVYTIEAQVFDAQGEILKGKIGADICTGSEDGRFTPNNTFLKNFRYQLLRYYNLIGVDKNENGVIDPLNFERINMAGFNVAGGYALYNTQNAINPLNDGFYVNAVGDIPPEYETFAGWGLGCIYNSAYKGGYCLPDVDRNNQLSFNDSLALDQEGKVKFKFYANDMGLTESFLGGFVGKNKLTTIPAWADVAGHPFGFQNDPYAPYDTWRRFRYSGARFYPNFAVDWDAHPDIYVSIKGPELRLLDARTHQPLGKELLNPNLYDLHYGIINYIVVQVIAADSRDLAIKEDGEALIYGANHEMYIRGKLKKGIEGVPETVLTYTPTGTGSQVGWIDYIRMEGGYDQFDDNLNVGLREYAYFDSTLGLALNVQALGDLYPRKKVTLRIKVFEGAAQTLVEGASVTVTGAGVNETKRTNSAGICEIDILPTEEGEIIITATKEKYLSGSEVIYIGKDTRPLFLYIDPLPEITREDSITFTGYTKSTATLSLNNDNVALDAKGNFSIKVSLNEGENRFNFVAISDSDRKEENRLIIRDSTPPEIDVFDTGTLVDVREVTLKGKVSEEGSLITVNGKSAEIIGLEWQITIPVDYGKNTLNIIVKDKVGNEKQISKEIYIYRKLIVEVQLGNKTVYLNGVPQAPLNTPPYLKDGKMMIPLRIISEVLGGKADWNPETKEVKITIDDKVVSMVIGSNVAIVNGQAVNLEVPPEIKEGNTFVPLRFISDAFDFEIEWIESTKTAKITRLI